VEWNTIQKKTLAVNTLVVRDFGGEFGESIVISPDSISHSALLFKVKACVCEIYFWKHFKCVLHGCKLFCMILLKGLLYVLVCHTPESVAFVCYLRKFPFPK